MIFDDLNKLILYQKLNLGFECSVCKSKFYNRVDHLAHIISCKKENLKCTHCGKVFGNQQILQLHLRFHDVSQSANNQTQVRPEKKPQLTPNCVNNSNTLHLAKEILLAKDRINELTKIAADNDKCEVSEDKSNNEEQTSAEEVPAGVHAIYRPRRRKPVAKKNVGLTKVRMEDCLRCDECSCIYIDSRDYYKHMRNFHKIDLINNVHIDPSTSKKRCRSCCKQCQCQGKNCSSPKRPRASRPGSNLIFKINVRNNLKAQFSRTVSHQPTPEPEPSTDNVDVKPDIDALAIKADPDAGLDLTHLLSQVEVKIKTEPEDHF